MQSSLHRGTLGVSDPLPAAAPAAAPITATLLWLWVGIPLLLVALFAVWGERFDLYVSDALFDPARRSFSYGQRWHTLLEPVMHDAGKLPLTLTTLAVIAAWCGSWLHPPLRRHRRTLGYLLLSAALGAGAVGEIKVRTNKHCPRELSRYGGALPYVPLLARAPAGNPPGRCWPGGHSTSGFGFLGFYFALRGHHRRAARLALAGALAAGTLLGTGRVLQGMHFMSHTLWAGVWCWTVALVLYLLVRPAWPAPRPARTGA